MVKIATRCKVLATYSPALKCKKNFNLQSALIIIIIMVATYIAHRSAKLALMALYIIYEHREKNIEITK